ncbi:MAG: hypothetical protein IK093_03635 [Ruminiclostridium sp.]|nr:hypothetical protein [Ruminiclostridium sp.]
MDSISNELIFWFGIGITAFSAVLAGIGALVFALRRIRLNEKLNEEYGKEGKRR